MSTITRYIYIDDTATWSHTHTTNLAQRYCLNLRNMARLVHGVIVGMHMNDEDHISLNVRVHDAKAHTHTDRTFNIVPGSLAELYVDARIIGLNSTVDFEDTPDLTHLDDIHIHRPYDRVEALLTQRRQQPTPSPVPAGAQITRTGHIT